MLDEPLSTLCKCQSCTTNREAIIQGLFSFDGKTDVKKVEKWLNSQYKQMRKKCDEKRKFTEDGRR